MGKRHSGVFYIWNGNILKEFNGINEMSFDPNVLVDALNYHKYK